MRIGKLSFGSPPFLCVVWKIPDFYQLAKESGCHLRSPEFPFADGRYHLRLFPVTIVAGSCVRIQLVNLTDAVPGRDVSYEVMLKSRSGEVADIVRRLDPPGLVFYIPLSFLQDDINEYFPDGTVTVICFVRLMEPNSAVTPVTGAVKTKLAISIIRMSGELSFESPPFLYVTWEIPHFSSLGREDGCSLDSPEFPFADGRYCLRLSMYTSRLVSVLRIRLWNYIDGDPGRDVSYQLGLKSRTGKEIDLYQPHKGYSHVIYRREVERKRDLFATDGTLTVFCFVVHPREPSSAVGPAETSDEEKEQELLPELFKLQSDYRQLLKTEADSDAFLVVSGKEFRVHKIILRSRSPVFKAMFDHDMAEKKSGRVVIDDLDPESFGDFLEYLYTGGVEAGLSNDNAFGLYKAADKYDVPNLKSECVSHMRRNLSVDSFCDVITLALRHQEEKLLQRAVMFFKENMARIIVTAKWQQFVIDNGRSANELFIKAFVPGEK